MNKPKFTPKPWNLTVENTRDGDIHIDICDNSGHFVGLVVNNANIGVDEALANANLMHAAPDMYEALEKIMEIELGFAQEYNVYADDSTIYAIAENALRKARVESEANK